MLLLQYHIIDGVVVLLFTSLVDGLAMVNIDGVIVIIGIRPAYSLLFCLGLNGGCICQLGPGNTYHKSISSYGIYIAYIAF